MEVPASRGPRTGRSAEAGGGPEAAAPIPAPEAEHHGGVGAHRGGSGGAAPGRGRTTRRKPTSASPPRKPTGSCRASRGSTRRRTHNCPSRTTKQQRHGKARTIPPGVEDIRREASALRELQPRGPPPLRAGARVGRGLQDLSLRRKLSRPQRAPPAPPAARDAEGRALGRGRRTLRAAGVLRPSTRGCSTSARRWRRPRRCSSSASWRPRGSAGGGRPVLYCTPDREGSARSRHLLVGDGSPPACPPACPPALSASPPA